MSNLEPGQSFGHYTIVSQSASDEYGTLYRAYDSAAAGDVLLRVLPASLATHSGELAGESAGFDTRFQALGAALRKLSHPNILRVLESGLSDGTPYLSMPIVEAAPLSERIASGQVAPAQADKLVGQIAAALQYAHANGVAHGALSPAHVLVDGAGNALLTDFGLAALQPASAAPDPHADVAALGGVLLSLLTGKSTPPDSAALADALGQLTSTLPADRRDAVGAAYAGVIARLTAAGPANQFDSARDFLTAWQEAGKSVGSAVAPTGSAPMGAAPMGAAPALTPPSQTPPAAPPPVTRPPMPGVSTPLSPAAQNLAQRAKALAEKQALARAKALADQTAQALADQQAAQAVPAAGPVQSDTDFAQAQARDAAARGAGAKGSVRDGVRAALEISQRLARATPDPARRAALEQIVADIQKIGDQRASGQLTDVASHAAISDLVRQVRLLEAQGMPAGRDAVKGVVAAALSQAEAPAVAQAVRQQAAAAVRPVAQRARPVLFGGLGLIMVVCVGLMIVCAVAVSALPGATPTPRAGVTQSLTRSAPTPTSRPSPARPAPRATTSAAVPSPAAPGVPLRTSVVFTGTFVSGQCDLAEGDDSNRTLKCERDEYVMLVKPSTSRWSYYDAPPEYQDIVIDFDTRAISSSPAMQYGIIWRISSDGQSFYGFTLKPSGQVAVFVSKDSDFSYFVQDLSVNNFRTGGGLNHVTITANGPQLSFAVNGEPLPLTLSDTTLTSGTIGFFVDTTAPNAQAAFSNLVVSEIQ